jgi:malonyl-CoA O-methyltransferase
VGLGARTPVRLCADARALPLAEHSVDLLFSNLCLQWVEDLPAVFAGFRRVLKPGGMVVISTFGPDTLHELRSAFAQADAVPHVSPFASIAQFGDALIAAGFRNPVLDRDELVTRYADLPALMRELRAIGATNALRARRHTLTGKARFAAAANAYDAYRDADHLPATWEIITALAWAPDHGVPIREGGEDVARIPASGIPVRRR